MFLWKKQNCISDQTPSVSSHYNPTDFFLLYSVVCYEHDRDEIRSRLIGWLKNQENLLEGVEGYRNLLKSYFDLMDENNDGKLDATEFREFVQANQSTEEVLAVSTIGC